VNIPLDKQKRSNEGIIHKRQHRKKKKKKKGKKKKRQALSSHR